MRKRTKVLFLEQRSPDGTMQLVINPTDEYQDAFVKAGAQALKSRPEERQAIYDAFKAGLIATWCSALGHVDVRSPEGLFEKMARAAADSLRSGVDTVLASPSTSDDAIH